MNCFAIALMSACRAKGSALIKSPIPSLQADVRGRKVWCERETKSRLREARRGMGTRPQAARVPRTGLIPSVDPPENTNDRTHHGWMSVRRGVEVRSEVARDARVVLHQLALAATLLRARWRQQHQQHRQLRRDRRAGTSARSRRVSPPPHLDSSHRPRTRLTADVARM